MSWHKTTLLKTLICCAGIQRFANGLICELGLGYLFLRLCRNSLADMTGNADSLKSLAFLVINAN